MASILDEAEQGAITASRIRGWDEISKGMATSQINSLNEGTPLTNNAVRFLDGTPGNFSGTQAQVVPVK